MMLLGMEIQIIRDRRIERIEGRFTRKSLPKEFQVSDGVSLTGHRQSNHIIAWLTESSTSFLRGLVCGEIKIIRFELALRGNSFAVGQAAGIAVARV